MFSNYNEEYKEYEEYDRPVCLVSNVDTDCDY